MVSAGLDWFVGIFETLLGCDPEASPSDPCKRKAKKYAIVAAIVVVIVVLILAYRVGKKFF